MRPAPTAAPVPAAPFGPWGSVIVSAALLATVGSTLGSIVMLGVIYAKVSGWSGHLPLWEYLKLRDVVEEFVLSIALVYAYRSWPATQRAIKSDGGVVKVALIFGTLALVATRIMYGSGFHQPGLLLAISWLLYVGCIAYPIVWTVARRAPDAEPSTAPNRLTDREFFKTILGLFLVVGSIHFMHWVMFSPTPGLINFFGLFVIPAAAVVLGIGARHAMAGACKVLEEDPPGAVITILAVVIGWAAVFYCFMFAHAPHSP